MMRKLRDHSSFTRCRMTIAREQVVNRWSAMLSHNFILLWYCLSINEPYSMTAREGYLQNPMNVGFYFANVGITEQCEYTNFLTVALGDRPYISHDGLADVLRKSSSKNLCRDLIKKQLSSELCWFLCANMCPNSEPKKYFHNPGVFYLDAPCNTHKCTHINMHTNVTVQ